MLRHATLYGSTEDWDATIVRATRVDSVLSSPSTKFLLAVLTVHAADARSADIAAMVPALGMSRTSDAAADRRRLEGCQRLPAATSLLDLAERRLREGGDRYAGGGVAQVRAALDATRSKLATLQTRCS